MIGRIADLPQAWLVPFALAGLALGRLLPLELPGALRLSGWLLIGAGLALMLWAAVTMRRARTTVMPGRRPDALVTHGPFRFSRNPIYLGDLLLLAGLMLAADALAGLMLLPGFIYLLQARFIQREEQTILAAYGAEFENYRARVRRWL